VRSASAGTVLLVEDEPEVMDVGVEILRSLGYDVLTANDAQAGLRMLEQNGDIDVLFTDVVMPKGMSGIDLARTALRLLPQLKVLLASGYPLPAISAQHGSLEDFAFISKPYRWTELADRLRGLQSSSRH
jgi:CheY-like chemotaxis protein